MFHDLYNKILRENKITSQAMAEYITEMGRSISKESIHKYRTGERTPDPEIIELSAEKAEVPVQDFFNPEAKEKIAKDEIRKDKEKYASLFPEIRSTASTVGIKILSDQYDEKVHIEKRLIAPEVWGQLDSNTVIYKMQGNDMEPYYSNNDILFIDMVNGRDVSFSDDIYLVQYGDIIRLKIVQFLGNYEVKLSSANKDYDDIHPTRDGLHWEILGKPFLHMSINYNTKFNISEE